MRLRDYILIIVGLVVLVSGCGLYLYLDSSIKAEVYENTKAADMSRLDFIFEQFDLHVSSSEKMLEYAAGMNITADTISAKNETSLSKLSEDINTIAETSPLIVNIGVFDDNCTILASDKIAQSIVLGKSYIERDYCKGILESKRTYISEAYESSVLKKQVFGISVPVKNSEGKFIGFVLGTIDLDMFEDSIDKISISEDQRILLVDRSGNLLFDSNPESSVFSSSQILSEFGSTNTLKSDKNYFDLGSDLLLFRKHDYGAILLIENKERMLYFENKLSQMIFLSILVMFISIFALLWYFSGMIVKPIEKTTKVVKDITSGNFEAKLERSGIYEVQQLNESLERVIASLKLAILRVGIKKSDIAIGEAMAAKEEAEKRYQALFNNLGDAVFVHDTVSGRFLDVNDVACKRLGYSKEELLDLSPQKIDAPDFSKQVPERIKQLEKDGHAIFETAHITKTGKVIPVELSSSIMDYRGKRVILSIAREITDRKKAVESEAQYKRLIESFGTEYFFYRHDTKGVFKYVSPSIQNVLGYSEEEFSTHYSEHLTNNLLNKKAKEYTVLSIKGKQQPSYLVEIYHKDGSIKTLEVLETPVFDDKGKVVSVEGIAHDVTGRVNKK